MLLYFFSGRGARRSRRAAQALLRQVFDAVDGDGGGTVDKRELLLAMENRGFRRTLEESLPVERSQNTPAH